MKPYVLDDQLCDECQGGRCGGKFAPFFCANVTCLQVREYWHCTGVFTERLLMFVSCVSTTASSAGPPYTAGQAGSSTNLSSRREQIGPELCPFAGVRKSSAALHHHHPTTTTISSQLFFFSFSLPIFGHSECNCRDSYPSLCK